MSTEFRLKYIRDVIDKNVNDVLLKWNAKKVFLDEPFDEDTKDTVCSACLKIGEKRFLRYSYVNIDEAVYKCESSNCQFPYRNFKYKNFADQTIFRYQRVDSPEVTNSDQKLFNSPTKLERDNVDGFNLSWLDYSFTSESDLDNILNASPQKTSCDIKEIINDICNGVQTPSADDYSEDYSQMDMNSFHNEHSPKLPTLRLSKCLKYIEHLSPQKRTSPRKMEVTSTPIQMDSNPIFKVPVSSSAKSIKKKIVKNGSKKDRKVVKKKHDTKTKSLINDQQSLGLFDFLDSIKNISPKQLDEIQPATSVKKENHQVLKKLEKTAERSLPILINFNSNQSPNDSVYHNSSTSYHVEVKVNSIAPPSDKCNIAPITNMIVPITSYLPEDISSTEQSSTVNNIQPIEPMITPTTSEFCELSSQPSRKAGNIKCDKNSDKNQVKKQRKIKNQQKPEAKTKIKESATVKQTTEQILLKRKLKQERVLKAKKLKKETLNRDTDVVKVNAKRKNINIEVEEEEEQFFGFDPLEPFKPFVLKKSPLIWIKSQ